MLNYKEGIYFRHKSYKVAGNGSVQDNGETYSAMDTLSLCTVIREVKSTYVVIHVCVHRFAYNITREF